MSLFGHVSPPSVEEAVSILASRPEAKVLAGGNNLLLPANRDALAGCLLVDLRKIHTLTGIERDADGGDVDAAQVERVREPHEGADAGKAREDLRVDRSGPLHGANHNRDGEPRMLGHPS